MEILRAWYGVDSMLDVLRVVGESGLEDTATDVTIDVDCARVARILKHTSRGRFGLLPASRGALVQAFARQLGFALSRMTQTLAVVLDPEQRSGFVPSEGAGTLYFAHAAAPGVAVLCPERKAPAGAKLEMVSVMLSFVEQSPDMYGNVLIDLFGCTMPGELGGVVRILDGIVVVGRAGQTTEDDLERTRRVIPRELEVGVVLTE